MVASPRWRLILVVSLTLIVAGIVLLITSLLTPPVSPAAPDTAGRHVAGHDSAEPGATTVQGVAVHPGPGVATLAEELRPVTGPTVILAVDVPPEATPTRAVPPGAVAQDL